MQVAAPRASGGPHRLTVRWTIRTPPEIGPVDYVENAIDAGQARIKFLAGAAEARGSRDRGDALPTGGWLGWAASLCRGVFSRYG